jgi:hypothetical protein
MKNPIFKKQAGYTLVELTIGVTVVALVIAGIVTAGRKLSQDVAFNEYVQGVQLGIASLKPMVKRSASTYGVITSTVAATGVFSPVAVLDGDVLVNRATGIRLQFDRNASIPNYASDRVIISLFTSLTTAQCMGLAGALEPTAVYMGVYSENSLKTMKNVGGNAAYTFDAAATACANPAALYVVYDKL